MNSSAPTVYHLIGPNLNVTASSHKTSIDLLPGVSIYDKKGSVLRFAAVTEPMNLGQSSKLLF